MAIETRELVNPTYSNVDPRQLQMFMRQPGFVQSLSSTEHSGMTKRVATAKWQPEERLVYDAVAEGYTSLDSLPIATGLTEAQVRAALASLTRRGYIKTFGVDQVGKEPLPL